MTNKREAESEAQQGIVPSPARHARTWVLNLDEEEDLAGAPTGPPPLVRLAAAVRREVRVFRRVTGGVFLGFLLLAFWLWWHRVYVVEAVIRPGALYEAYETVLKKPENLLGVARTLDLFQRLKVPDTEEGRGAMVASLQKAISVAFSRPTAAQAASAAPPPAPVTYRIVVEHRDRGVAMQVCDLLLSQLQREGLESGRFITASMAIRNTPNALYFAKYLFAPRVGKDIAKRLEILKDFASEDEAEAAKWLEQVVVLGDPNLSNPYFTLGARGRTRKDALARLQRLFEILSDWPVEKFGELTDTKFVARVKIYPTVDQKYFRDFVYSQRCLMPIVRAQGLTQYYKVPSDVAALRYLSDNIRFVQERTPALGTGRSEVDPGQYLAIEVHDYRPEMALKILRLIADELQSWVREMPSAIDNVIRFGDRVRFLASLPDAKVNSNVPASVLTELTNPRGAISLKVLDPPYLVDSHPTKQALEVIEGPHVGTDRRALLDILAPPYVNTMATSRANRAWKVVLVLGLLAAPILGLAGSWSVDWWRIHRQEVIEFGAAG